MKQLQAVLDTNVWLATHVVAITLGYTATFLAGALAVAYILIGVFTNLLTARKPVGQTRIHPPGCFREWSMQSSASPSFFRSSERFWRHLGRPIMGAILGLGPQRKWRGSDCLLECPDLARPLVRHCPSTRRDDPCCIWKRRHELVVVRHQHAWSWPPLLWLYGRRWRGGRAAECAGFENRLTERLREFESPLLR